MQAQQNGPQQVYTNKADYLRANADSAVQQVVNDYLKKYPDDFHGAQIQETRARSEINKQITMEDGRLKSDRDIVTNAISGAYTKGVPPMTHAELAAIPNMQPVLDRVMKEQGGFSGGLDTMIAKASHKDSTVNSNNGFDTVMRSLEPHDGDHPNSIGDQDKLSKLLARSDGTGINWKDYQDSKGVLEESTPWKDFLHENMQTIASANGNVDGQGQQRAMDFFQKMNALKKQNDALGDKKMNEPDFIKELQEKQTPTPPGILQQIKNWATKSAQTQSVKQVMTPADYAAIPSGQQYKDPDGNIRTKK